MADEKVKKINPMKNINIEKITVNVCVGNDRNKMERAKILLEKITQKKPSKCAAKRRLATWQIRPGLPIGYKVTLRGEDAKKFLQWTIESKQNKISQKSLDKFGNFGLGFLEYLELKGLKYDSDIGILGFELMTTFKRSGGKRVQNRLIKKSKIPMRHKTSKDEVIDFLKNNFKAEVI